MPLLDAPHLLAVRGQDEIREAQRGRRALRGAGVSGTGPGRGSAVRTTGPAAVHRPRAPAPAPTGPPHCPRQVQALILIVRKNNRVPPLPRPRPAGTHRRPAGHRQVGPPAVFMHPGPRVPRRGQHGLLMTGLVTAHHRHPAALVRAASCHHTSVAGDHGVGDQHLAPRHVGGGDGGGPGAVGDPWVLKRCLSWGYRLPFAGSATGDSGHARGPPGEIPDMLRSARTLGCEMSASRTYQIRTYGCQMNMHDSERLAGLLEEAGYQRAPGGRTRDVVVFNTCAVRENADNRLYGNLGHLLPVKNARPGMQIAVGGCLAQKDRAGIAERAPWVDVVFGTHNIGSLPALLERARVQAAGAGRDRRVAGAFPLGAARPPRVALLGVGGHLGRLQQHLHVLHRAEPARPGGGPPAGRRARRDPGAGRRRRPRGHAARAERQLLRGGFRRPAGVRQAAARLRRRSTGWSGSASPRRTRATSPTT